ncbi:hypothetical protein SK637_00143 [Streptococcus mitis]|nr:hypothetical protein SK637_00143 [Streptococcus mitis]
MFFVKIFKKIAKKVNASSSYNSRKVKNRFYFKFLKKVEKTIA